MCFVSVVHNQITAIFWWSRSRCLVFLNKLRLSRSCRGTQGSAQSVAQSHLHVTTHSIVQRSADISPVERWIEGQVLPKLPLQLIKVSISRIAEPAKRKVKRRWRESREQRDLKTAVKSGLTTLPAWLCSLMDHKCNVRLSIRPRKKWHICGKCSVCSEKYTFVWC